MNRKTIRILMLLLVAMSLGIGKAKAQSATSYDYIDENGVLQNTATDNNTANDNVIVLTGAETETTLNMGTETWCVAKGNVTYSGGINFNDDTHLILADGATMTVSKSDASCGAISAVKNLSIYGQAAGSGLVQVSASKTSASESVAIGIIAKAVTINGGKVTVESDYSGIATYGSPDGDITINGGVVTVVGKPNVALARGIEAQGGFTINGGMVSTTGTERGIYACEGDITLGWRSATDYISANKYFSYSGAVKTADGKKFAVYTVNGTDETLEGAIGSTSGSVTLDADGIAAIGGKKLRPFGVHDVSVPAGCKYFAYSSQVSGTVFNPDVKAYVVTSVSFDKANNQFVVGLAEAAGVVADLPMIFCNATEGADLPTSILIENGTVTGITALTNFIACDGSTTVADLLTAAGLNADDVLLFGLSGTSFKRVLLASGDKPSAGKCFLALPKLDFMLGTINLGSAASATRGLGVETDGTTSIIDNGKLTMDNSASVEWYSLDGRRLSKEPAQKGVYIRNGKKLVIK